MVRKSREIGAGPLPSVVHLLTQLKVKNQQRNEDGPYRGFFPQLLKSPENFKLGIPSLAKGIYLPPSPMIRVRFETVGRWVNAAFGQTWLGIEDMKKAWSSTMTKEQTKLRLADWPNSPLQNHPPELTSLFGLDPGEGEDTYLLWPETKGEEPKILCYMGYEEEIHCNLADFLERLIWQGTLEPRAEPTAQL